MQRPIPTQPHSGLGIAAFIISLSADTLLLGLIGIADLMEPTHDSVATTSAPTVLFGFIVIFATLAMVLALALGIAALVQTGRHKLFGVLGTVFAALGLTSSLLLFLIGILTMEG